MARARECYDGQVARDFPSSPETVSTPPQRLPRLRQALKRRPCARRDFVFLGVAGGWLAFDQITKAIVRATLDRGEHWELASFFRFSHITNRGAAFGLFENMQTFLVISAVIVIAVLLAYFLVPPANHWLPRLGLALILGGAMGNLLDRLYQGRVTDFINFNHYPAFNVADSGITLGVVAVVLFVLLSERRGPAEGGGP